MSTLELDVRTRLGAFGLEAAFAAPATGITCLFGRSGAGKTTLINILAGLLRPSSGRVALGDEVLFDSARGIDVPPERRGFGYVFQEGRLFPHMTVRRNLLYGANRQPAAGRQRRLDHAVDLLAIEPLLERRPRDLSGGEKQRVAIGRALMTAPRLLLMDEPLAALDPGLKAEILPYIERLRDIEGVPIVYVTHTIEEIVRLATTLVLVSDGEVAAVGAVDELMNRLDLRPLTGRYEAGAVIETIVAEQEADGLTALTFAGGTLLVPRIEAEVGTPLRVRVRARDVSLSLTAPPDISILNAFPGEVREVGPVDGALQDIGVDIGVPLWSRVTARSAARLELRPGRRVVALVKAVAIDRHSFGGVRDRPLTGP
ncbi:MAG: molybdenum ABC transporter ATP-binding protein [Inquilinus sp.]|nr:molybdenum ABC transporter ATP-binding protein [Inquilinus sp.]